MTPLTLSNQRLGKPPKFCTVINWKQCRNFRMLTLVLYGPRLYRSIEAMYELLVVLCCTLWLYINHCGIGSCLDFERLPAGMPDGVNSEWNGVRILNDFRLLLPTPPGGDSCNAVVGVPLWNRCSWKLLTAVLRILWSSTHSHHHRQGGRSARHRRLLCKAGVPVVAPAAVDDANDAVRPDSASLARSSFVGRYNHLAGVRSDVTIVLYCFNIFVTRHCAKSTGVGRVRRAGGRTAMPCHMRAMSPSAAGYISETPESVLSLLEGVCQKRTGYSAMN